MTDGGTGSGGIQSHVRPLDTQRSFNFMSIEEEPEMTVEQLRFRTNSKKLREKGIFKQISGKDLQRLNAEALLMTFKAMAGRDGGTDFLRQKAQNEAISKCITGDLEGLLEEAGIDTEAFLDQVKNAFPDDKPRQALIKFANLVYERFDAIRVEDEELRVRERRIKYDDDYFLSILDEAEENQSLASN